MSIVRRIARPLLAASFVAGGLDAVLHPSIRAEAARPLVERVAPKLGVPSDPELFVRAGGAAAAVAGTLFAAGRLPRLSSLVLAVTLAPATYVEYPFWQEKDPALKRSQRVLFLKNVGLLGASLITAVDTQGQPGLAWRGRRAAKDAKRTAKQARRTARRATKDARASATHARDTARLEVRDARDAVRSAASALPH
jgi:uncharacterized membrane protein YphA (DoxX/SURF4 family)